MANTEYKCANCTTPLKIEQKYKKERQYFCSEECGKGFLASERAKEINCPKCDGYSGIKLSLTNNISGAVCLSIRCRNCNGKHVSISVYTKTKSWIHKGFQVSKISDGFLVIEDKKEKIRYYYPLNAIDKIEEHF